MKSQIKQTQNVAETSKVAEALTAAVRNSTYLETEKNNTKGKTKSIVDKTQEQNGYVSKKELFKL